MRRYVIRLQAANMRCEVRINDIPVALVAPGESAGPIDVPVNEFVIPGSNVMAVTANANPLPSRVREPWAGPAESGVQAGAPARLTARLFAEEGHKPVGWFTPVDIAWAGPAAPNPVTQEKAFNVGDSSHAWGWTRAAVLNPATAAADAHPILVHLHRLLQAGDIGGLATVLQAKLQEVTADAYDIAAGPMANALRQQLQACMQSPEWTLLPVDRPQVDLRLVAGRRLVECLRPNGTPALTYVSQDEEEFSLPVMLGVLDGRWAVLR
ncbi:hypothetical protein [Ramlibacter sp.]|uniref:hypothetical protein n=1 Tax=Ramlibacter sp. TaxID=1917967 RepID=UPI002D580B27|nr:hypothetical protein [Ramlibacter sp.]HYD76638.1 hypothetical protein [Ramlibacter sp.]